MKLFIQIPCLNEEATLPLVLATIPTDIPGIDDIQLMIIDDGCTDNTVAVARSLGVQHVVHHAKPMGLARAFRDGVDYALKHGADIVVNTDGDNQYPSEAIGELVQPIVRHEADIVVGDRQTAKISEFSGFKKAMQHFGSWVVNKAAGTHIPDAASEFRAYSKRSLIQLNIVTEFSYCMETIIQAGNKRIAIASYAITTNPKTRESRLFSNIFEHMAKSGGAIIRSFLMFKSNVIFKWAALIFGVLGLVPIIRFLVFSFQGDGSGHVQSMLLGVALLMIASVCIALQIISEVQRIQRRLVEDELERTKEIQYSAPYQAIWASQDEWGAFMDSPEGGAGNADRTDRTSRTASAASAAQPDSTISAA
jgi:glycosyltransferase involved in cell wall biosynthesis